MTIPMEYPADDEPIYPCTDCLPWSVEVVLDHPTLNGVWVREWHAIGCGLLAHFLDAVTSPGEDNR